MFASSEKCRVLNVTITGPSDSTNHRRSTKRKVNCHREENSEERQTSLLQWLVLGDVLQQH